MNAMQPQGRPANYIRDLLDLLCVLTRLLPSEQWQAALLKQVRGRPRLDKKPPRAVETFDQTLAAPAESAGDERQKELEF